VVDLFAEDNAGLRAAVDAGCAEECEGDNFGAFPGACAPLVGVACSAAGPTLMSAAAATATASFFMLFAPIRDPVGA